MEEKMRILNMLSEGKISPDEAEKLLTALDVQMEQSKSAQDQNRSSQDVTPGQKFLYVQVEPKDGKSSDRVSVKVPFGLVKAGLNIAGLIPEEAQEQINTSMGEKGFSFNLKDISKDNIDEILAALEQFTVDVDTEEASVQVYCK
ncbi:MAG: hypothetical protein JEY99_03550 [Spirochaetales bacterium]|nr:hypothetical protein [Spirochaetales bacterium]